MVIDDLTFNREAKFVSHRLTPCRFFFGSVAARRSHSLLLLVSLLNDVHPLIIKNFLSAITPRVPVTLVLPPSSAISLTRSFVAVPSLINPPIKKSSSRRARFGGRPRIHRAQRCVLRGSAILTTHLLCSARAAQLAGQFSRN